MVYAFCLCHFLKDFHAKDARAVQDLRLFDKLSKKYSAHNGITLGILVQSGERKRIECGPFILVPSLENEMCIKCLNDGRLSAIFCQVSWGWVGVLCFFNLQRKYPPKKENRLIMDETQIQSISKRKLTSNSKTIVLPS